jgi:hypothetical protein
LSIKNQAKINKQQDQLVVNTIIKTLHGLKPSTRYDAKHCKSTSTIDVPKTLKEELAIDGKQKMIKTIGKTKKYITQR